MYERIKLQAQLVAIRCLIAVLEFIPKHTYEDWIPHDWVWCDHCICCELPVQEYVPPYTMNAACPWCYVHCTSRMHIPFCREAGHVCGEQYHVLVGVN